MLKKYKFVTPIAVNDIENAIDFYGNVLGLKRVEQNTAGFVFEVNGGRIGLHESPSAGSSQATCAWWTVDDIEVVVKRLKSRGVVFDKNYDLPKTKQVDDIYLLNERDKAAWFRDPDGNILGIGNY